MKHLSIAACPAKFLLADYQQRAASYSLPLPESEVRRARASLISQRHGPSAELAKKAFDRQRREVLMRAIARNDASAADDIDPTCIDLSDALKYVDFPSDTLPVDEKKLNRQRREVLECMRAFAKEAYIIDPANAASIGNLKRCTEKSTPTMKFWEVTSHSDIYAVVLGFSGTRVTKAADLLCDLKGQIPQPHVNPLGSHLPRLGLVGHGWQERWRSEALEVRGGGQQLADILASYTRTAQQSCKPLSVSVVGHSLGAVVASMASIDIANFLHTIGAKGKVSAYVFNPPRLGFRNIEGTYRKALASNPSQGDTLRFTLLQFTRELDPVQSLPLFMEHPDWSKRQPDKDIQNASLDLRINTYNDRAADRVNLTANHRLVHWKSIIASGISEDTLKSLFDDGRNDQDTNQAFRISR